MVLHNTQLRHCFRDRVTVIFLWLLFSQPMLCGLVKSCLPPPAKASARWVRAIAASLRSPKMNQKIIGAMFSRLFLNTHTKKICVTLCSACLQLLFIIFEFLPPSVLNVNSILWYRNLGYRRLMGVLNSRFELNH